MVDFDTSADAEIPDVHDAPSWSPESARRFGVRSLAERLYLHRVAADPTYCNSRRRWLDHLRVYPDTDRVTRDNCLMLARKGRTVNAAIVDEAREWAEWLAGPDNDYGMTPDEEKGAMYVLALLDLLDGHRVRGSAPSQFGW